MKKTNHPRHNIPPSLGQGGTAILLANEDDASNPQLASRRYDDDDRVG